MQPLLIETLFTLFAWHFALSFVGLVLFLSHHIIMILLEKVALFWEEREEKREKQRRRERPDAQKEAEAFILLKSIQERARTIRPTPYKLISNIHCVLNKVCF